MALRQAQRTLRGNIMHTDLEKRQVALTRAGRDGLVKERTQQAW